MTALDFLIARPDTVDTMTTLVGGSAGAVTVDYVAYALDDFGIPSMITGGRGFFEAQTLRLISTAQLADNPSNAEGVAVKNPLSEDHTTLRPSIVPGLIATAALNTWVRVGGTPTATALPLAAGAAVPDIVLADYHLDRGACGIAAIERLRAAVSDSELPAIIITGDTDPALIRSMADRGIARLTGIAAATLRQQGA